MPKKTFVLFWMFLVAIFVSSIATAQVREKFTSIGNPSCSRWNRDLQEYKAQGPDKIYEWVGFYIDRAWAFGFATGAGYIADDDLLNDLDASVIVDWTTKFCKENAEKNVSDAVMSLLVETKKIVNQTKDKPTSSKRQKKN